MINTALNTRLALCQHGLNSLNAICASGLNQTGAHRLAFYKQGQIDLRESFE